ncbi:DUF397 domain-containing protein [Streptomyces sp. NPDC091287]|uniref:DUF397 domain-containing protein n=1 Tax=Streptomyces sp. NPDC091287 TaxID=3365988 RepID=UPI00381D094C
MHSTEPAIADRIAPSAWRKSSYSGGANADCLEVAHGHTTVPVRDSKAADGPAVAFSSASWSSFVTAIRGGEFPS